MLSLLLVNARRVRLNESPSELFVCLPEARDAYPERQGFREHHSQWCRSPKPLAELMELMESHANERLRAGGHSEMIVEELVGGRLYTGPMVGCCCCCKQVEPARRRP